MDRVSIKIAFVMDKHLQHQQHYLDVYVVIYRSKLSKHLKSLDKPSKDKMKQEIYNTSKQKKIFQDTLFREQSVQIVEFPGVNMIISGSLPSIQIRSGADTDLLSLISPIVIVTIIQILTLCSQCITPPHAIAQFTAFSQTI